MAAPEYHQTAEDHTRLLILVKQVSPDHLLSRRSFDRIYERISRVSHVRIADAQGLGLERVVRLRFVKDEYSEESNEWGDFQYHRKLLSLISVAKVPATSPGQGHSHEEEVIEVRRQHEQTVDRYNTTLLDSRCILLCPTSSSSSASSSATEDLLPNNNNNSHFSDRTSVSRMNSRSSVSSFHDPDTPTKSGVPFPPSLLTSHRQEEDNESSDARPEILDTTNEPEDTTASQEATVLDEDSGNHSIDTTIVGHDEEDDGGKVKTLDHPLAPIPSQDKSSDSDDDVMHDKQNNETKGQNGDVRRQKTTSFSRVPADEDPLTMPKHANVRTIGYRSRCSASNEVSDACLSVITSQLESEVKDLVSSLFWVLESKRLERSHDKSSSRSSSQANNLLMAPFESKTLVGVDTKKRAAGRIKKQAGDLCLLSDCPAEALVHYGSAIEVLKSTGDFLWMAAAIEGQCVASLCLLFPEDKEIRSQEPQFQRNSSLPPSAVMTGGRANRRPLTTSSHTRSQSQPQDELQSTSNVKQQAARSTSSSTSSSPSPSPSQSGSSLSIVNNNNASIENKKMLRSTFSLSHKRSASSSSGKDKDLEKALSKLGLRTSTELCDKYKESCCHYAKFRNAAVIEMECSFKAARVLTRMQDFMSAAEFIQNAVFISLNQSNDEQIERLSVISNLYTEIGFNRKAAFYKRFAALKTVSLQLQQPNWSMCYNLLISSMDGYSLTLDPEEYERRIRDRDSSSGWTGIHVQLLQELITTAKRMNATPVAIRHLSFLLQVLSSCLTSAQKKEFASQLESLSRVCGEGAPVPLNLDSGFVIPSVNLTKFPYVTVFTCKNLPPHLRPFKLKSRLELEAPKGPTPASPFIFTPINVHRPLSANKWRNSSSPSGDNSCQPPSQTLDFKWVQHETGSVLMQVFNQLPIELTVDHMKLVTNGVPFEVAPICVSFGPDSGPTPVTLTGTAKAAGRLEVNGYSTHVLGVKSNCLLRDLPHGRRMRVPQQFVIDVVPALPLLSLSCPDLDKAMTSSSSFSNEIDYISANYGLQLLAGESRSVSIFLSNSSSHADQMIESIDLRVVSRLKKMEESLFISCPTSVDMGQKLPLAPGSSFEFSIDFYGFSDFVLDQKSGSGGISGRRKSGTTTPMNQLFLGPNSGACSPSGFGSNRNSVNSGGRPSTAGSASGANNNTNLQIGTALSNFLSKLQSGSPRVPKDKAGDRSDSSLEVYPSKVCSDCSGKVLIIIFLFLLQEFDVVIEFEYSGGPGLKSGYCRKSALSFSVEILPSVLLTQWHVLPAELCVNILNIEKMSTKLIATKNRSTRCYLVVDVLNATSEEMELNYSANKSILIESKETCRVPIEIERCSMHQEDVALSPSVLSAKCRTHLSQQVRLEYSVTRPGKETKGTASIDSIPWTQMMLETILMSPVQWLVSANDNDLPIERPEVNCSVGETVNFKLGLHNHSHQPIMYTSLWIEMFQEQSNGLKNYDVESKIMREGKDKIYVEEVLVYNLLNIRTRKIIHSLPTNRSKRGTAWFTRWGTSS